MLLYLFVSLIMAMVIHEGAHWLTAKFYGQDIKFRFEFGWLGFIPIPRGVWNMPDIESWKQALIALAGFGAELISALVGLFVIKDTYFSLTYVVVVIVHLVAYQSYAGEANDFRWL